MRKGLTCELPLRRHCSMFTAVIILLLAVVLYGAAEPKASFQHDPASKLANPALLFAAFVLMVGLFQPLLAALVVLMLTTRQDAGWTTSARLLSQPVFQRLAALSYDVYLLHPFVSYPLAHSP